MCMNVSIEYEELEGIVEDVLDVLEVLDGLVTDVFSGVVINLSIKSPLAQKAGLFLFFLRGGSMAKVMSGA